MMKKRQRKEWVIGLFALVVLVLLVFSYFFLKGNEIFSSVRRYYVKFDNVDGLYKGNRVMLNGLTIGRVSALTYTGRAGESVLVELQVSPAFQLSATTRAAIVNSGLIGGRVIKLFEAVGPAPYLQDNDTIAGRTEGALAESFEESVGPLMVRVDTLVGELTRLTSSVNGLMTDETKNSIQQMVVNINAASAQIAAASAKLPSIFDGADRAVRNVAEVAGSADSVVDGANAVLDSLRGINFRATIANIERASRAADSLLAELQRGEGTAGKLLKDDAIYWQAQRAIASFDSLVTDVKLHPKRYIKISVF